MRERPTAFVAQRMVMLSSHPTVVDGKLASRHVDLRPLRLPRPRRRRARRPGRPDPRRLRRGRAGGQLVPERRGEGHVGAGRMSRPLIGVTTSEVRLAAQADPSPEGDPPQREMALGMVYMRAVELAGGLPVVLPPLGHDTIAPLLDRLCGVCLSGGPDIDPDGYGEPARNPAARRRRSRDLDAYELALAQLADARGMPVLGICRGSQAINVARGGTLHQHLGDITDGSIQHRQTAPRARADPPRADRARARGWRATMGVTEAAVNSFHHQAVDRLGRGLRAVAWSPGRGRRGHRGRQRRHVHGRAVARRVARRVPGAARALPRAGRGGRGLRSRVPAVRAA